MNFLLKYKTEATKLHEQYSTIICGIHTAKNTDNCARIDVKSRNYVWRFVWIDVFVHCNDLLAIVVSSNSIEILKKAHTHKVTTTNSSHNAILRSNKPSNTLPFFTSILAQLFVFFAVRIVHIIVCLFFTLGYCIIDLSFLILIK